MKFYDVFFSIQNHDYDDGLLKKVRSPTERYKCRIPNDTVGFFLT